MAENYLGTDMAFDEELFTALGDAELVTSRKCLLQDIKLRLTTMRGDLWCHPAYGVDLYRFLHLESSMVNRLDLTQTIEDETTQDPRVRSAIVSINSWDGYTVKLSVIITPIDDSNPINLVLGYNLATMTAEVLNGG